MSNTPIFLVFAFWIGIGIFVFWFLTRNGRKRPLEYRAISTEKDTVDKELEQSSQEDSEFDGAMMGDCLFPPENFEDEDE